MNAAYRCHWPSGRARTIGEHPALEFAIAQPTALGGNQAGSGTFPRPVIYHAISRLEQAVGQW
jgi:hypothetical protein